MRQKKLHGKLDWENQLMVSENVTWGRNAGSFMFTLFFLGMHVQLEFPLTHICRYTGSACCSKAISPLHKDKRPISKMKWV